MPRYYVIKRRGPDNLGANALDVLAREPDVNVVDGRNPDMVLIESNEAASARLQEQLKDTHYVEPEIRRGLH